MVVICDRACKCSECVYYQNDTDRERKVCFATPDCYGKVHAQKIKSKGEHKYASDKKKC